MTNTPSEPNRVDQPVAAKVGDPVTITPGGPKRPTPSRSKLTARERDELFQAWKASEEVAMHFNNLLSGFRLKAIGGIAVGAVVGVGLKPHVTTPMGVCFIFFSLTTIWALVWAADFLYYYRGRPNTSGLTFHL